MSRAGKTFYFASLWLDRSLRADVATTYCFCRLVDDIADTLPIGARRSDSLRCLAEAISSHNLENPDARDILAIIERFPQIRSPIEQLIRSCDADVPGLVIETVTDLIHYAHGVAGTVGLVMYPLLGGTDPAGQPLAADLGIAMQLTNIARDVLSDLEQGRVYLPREWLKGRDLSDLLLYEPTIETIAVGAVHQLLSLANQYYLRGLQGLPYLNTRCRFAIRLAAHCYAAIGTRVVRNGVLARQRAVVPLHAKILLIARAAQPLNASLFTQMQQEMMR
jgi:phytoene synthase